MIARTNGAGEPQLSVVQELIGLVKRDGHLVLDTPVLLASGDMSRHFIDVKRALATGRATGLAAEAVLERAEGTAFDAVGGLTMGADVLAHGIAMLRPDVEWFSVRKAAKDRGTQQRIEGARLRPGRRVLLVDDVVTRGGSILEALDVITDTGATVVAAIAVVDRGDDGGAAFDARGIPFSALMTYQDLGIPRVGSESGPTEATG